MLSDCCSGQASINWRAQHVSKTASGVTTTYLIDGQTSTGYTQIAEERVSGEPLKSYVYGPQRVSMRDGAGLHYYGYDAHSGVRLLMNSTGAVTDTWAYDAFGNLIGRSGTTANDFTYRGEQMDSTLGLQYLRARWMNPSMARLATRDTWEGVGNEPQSLHPYGYVAGDPISYMDPSGHITSSSPELGALAEKVLLPFFMAEGALFSPPHLRFSNRWMNTIKNIIAPQMSGFWGRDRADFLDATSREVWELKPNNPFSNAFAYADEQVTRYMTVLEALGMWNLGSPMNFPMPRILPLGDAGRHWALYRYYTPFGGLIVYDIFNEPDGRRLQSNPSQISQYAADDDQKAALRAGEVAVLGTVALAAVLNAEAVVAWSSAALAASVGAIF